MNRIDTMVELDLVKYKLALETRRRCELAATLVQSELKEAREKVQQLEQQLAMTYRIGPKDSLDLNTGKIEREFDRKLEE